MLALVFAGHHYHSDIILWDGAEVLLICLSYREVEEILKGGAAVDHATVARWVQVYGPEIKKRLRRQPSVVLLLASEGNHRED